MGANKDTSATAARTPRPMVSAPTISAATAPDSDQNEKTERAGNLRVTLAVIVHVWQVRVQLETGMTDISIDVAYGSGFGVWALENVGFGALGLNPRTQSRFQKPKLPNFASNQTTSLVAAVLTPLPGIHRLAVTAQGASLFRLS